ncbi:formate dehydrogenase subunit delta [Candidatus Rariloculus sp.]|uniref:formate dehydrogenase subunit delta n=1 Tax=Candidatus Rariloculus sp. TaxID=3101265 RepID=UPI003D0A9139
MNVNKLVRMANQIAENFDYGPDKHKAAEGTADHLRRFWTPEMKQLIIPYSRQDRHELSKVAALAVAKLGQGQSG